MKKSEAGRERGPQGRDDGKCKGPEAQKKVGLGRNEGTKNYLSRQRLRSTEVVNSERV